MTDTITPAQAAAAIDPAAAKAARDKWRGKSSGEIKAELDRIAADQRKAVEQAGDDLDFSKSDILAGKTLQEKVTSLITMHSDLAGVQDALNERRGLEAVAQRIREGSDTGLDEAMAQAEQQLPQGVRDPYQGAVSYAAPRVPTIGDVFMEVVQKEHGGLAGIQNVIRGGNRLSIPVDLGENARVMNATFDTTDWDPFVTRLPGYVPDAQRPIFFLDVIPRYTTNQHSIKYMEETTFTNPAAETAEGTAYPEAELVVTERTVNIRDIGTHIPASEDVLADEGQVRSYITQRLPFMVRQRADAQVIAGDGTGNNLSGVLNVSNVQTRNQPGGASPTKPLNVVRQAMTQVRLAGRAMPSHILVHQTYWENMVLSETTAAGFYLGSAVMGMQNRLWGLPVVEGDSGLSVNANDDYMGVVGDFTRFGACAVRKDASIMVGYIDDDFSKRQIRFRADMRLAAVWYRGAAFVRIQRKA